MTMTEMDLERLIDIWLLLRRAERMGYSLTLSPQKAAELASLLETCSLVKPKVVGAPLTPASAGTTSGSTS